MKNLLWGSILLVSNLSNAQTLYQDFNTSLGLGTCWGQSSTSGVVFRQTTPPSTNVHEGSGALGMYSCCGNPGQPAMYISPELPDGSHDVSFWIKSSSSGCGPTLDVGICGTAGANFEIIESVSGWPNPAVWFFVSMTVVTNAAKKRIALQEPLGGSCTIFIDELTITNAGNPADCEEYVLPTQLIDFNAIEQEDKIKLNWKISFETNLKGFEVERSANGMEFLTLAFTPSQGQRTTYSFTDAQPLPEYNFYRLKMLDYDGYSVYSKVIEMACDNVKPILQVFPVPAREELTIQWRAEYDEDSALIQIIDHHGRVLLQQEAIFAKGIQAMTLPITTLPPGAYIVRCNGVSRRFDKQ
jgi:hypothetical protein